MTSSVEVSLLAVFRRVKLILFWSVVSAVERVCSFYTLGCPTSSGEEEEEEGEEVWGEARPLGYLHEPVVSLQI